jgi:hypothetical protein
MVFSSSPSSFPSCSFTGGASGSVRGREDTGLAARGLRMPSVRESPASELRIGEGDGGLVDGDMS